jgi:6-phosphogluconolactonase (cycloisomerase 2 family)
MRLPIKPVARSAGIMAPLISRNCSTPAPGNGSEASTWGRVLLSTAGRIIVSDLSDSGSFTTTLDGDVSGTDPSWMAFRAPNLLYAVDEWSNTTRLYTLDLEANTLDVVAERQASTGVVHLELNRAGTRMVGAAYGNGTIDVWKVGADADEGLELLKTVVSDGEPSKAVEGRQDASHPHQAVLDNTGRYFLVNDLGTDEVLVLDSQDDSFGIVNRVQVEKGCGPRHSVFWPPFESGANLNSHYLVVCEISNKVLTYKLTYSPEKGIDFALESSVPTWDPASPPSNTTTAAAGEIVLAGDSDVYVSNRLTGDDTDSIAHFRFAPESGLVFADQFSSGGKLPRMMSVSQAGDRLLVATQDGEQGVSVLSRDPADGVVDEKPLATIKGAVFGEAGFGPKYIVQLPDLS